MNSDLFLVMKSIGDTMNPISIHTNKSDAESWIQRKAWSDIYDIIALPLDPKIDQLGFEIAFYPNWLDRTSPPDPEYAHVDDLNYMPKEPEIIDHNETMHIKLSASNAEEAKILARSIRERLKVK